MAIKAQKNITNNATNLFTIFSLSVKLLKSYTKRGRETIFSSRIRNCDNERNFTMKSIFYKGVPKKIAGAKIKIILQLSRSLKVRH